MKKLTALILVLAILLVTAGCGGNASNSSGGAPAGNTGDAGNTAAASDGGSWPERPIEVIVPFSPGGDTDFNARAYLELLSQELGQPVVASNVTGGGGTVASRQVKDSKPDGYTVLFYHTVINVNEAIGTADYGFEEFEIAGIAGKGPGEIIAVRKDSGFENLTDLVEYSQANPGELDLAVDFGTMVHINGMQMLAAGADLNFVDAGGANDRVAALAGGHVDIIINSYGTIKDYLETGEFVALGHTNETKSPGFPEIIPAKEQGYDIQLEKHYFFAFPKDTPQEIVDQFSAAMKAVAENEDYQEAIFTAYRQEPFYADQQEALRLLGESKVLVQSFRDELMG